MRPASSTRRRSPPVPCGSVPFRRSCRPKRSSCMKSASRGCADKTSLQGCWIDWDLLRGNLLSEIADLLPQADLKLLDHPLESEQTRMLAAVPVRLDPGAISASATPGLSPVGMALVFAWGAM